MQLASAVALAPGLAASATAPDIDASKLDAEAFVIAPALPS